VKGRTDRKGGVAAEENRNGPRPDAVTHKRENKEDEEIRERGGLSVCVLSMRLYIGTGPLSSNKRGR